MSRKFLAMWLVVQENLSGHHLAASPKLVVTLPTPTADNHNVVS
jgi:hypothetical protein